MINLTDANFKEHTEKEGVHVVDFWATWCGPCKMYGPIFESSSTKFVGDESVNMYKVDVDSAPQMAKSFGVTSVPTTLFIKDGQLIKKVTGVQQEAILTEAITTLKGL